MIEILQYLKHLFKEERVDLASHLVAKEEDYAVDAVTETAINELVATGNTEELLELFRAMDKAQSS